LKEKAFGSSLSLLPVARDEIAAIVPDPCFEPHQVRFDGRSTIPPEREQPRSNRGGGMFAALQSWQGLVVDLGRCRIPN
jgi:hypothetical protein